MIQVGLHDRLLFNRTFSITHMAYNTAFSIPDCTAILVLQIKGKKRSGLQFYAVQHNYTIEG